jgi:multisubunit Na+/H+ antiporter MnhG subunit
MSLLGFIIAIIAASLLIIAALAFLKAKDVFVMSHVVMAANFYIIPLLLIGVEIERFSMLSFGKIIILILLNLVVTILLCHATLRRAIINKITPDAEVKTFNK